MKSCKCSFSQATKSIHRKRKSKVTDEGQGHRSRNVQIRWNNKNKMEEVIMHTRINSENQISIKSILHAIYICSFHYLFSVNSRPSFIVHGATRSLTFPVPRYRSNFIEGVNKQRELEGLTKYRQAVIFALHHA